MRHHSGIENALSGVLDVSCDENACRIRKGQGSQTFAVLRHIAVNLLRRTLHHKRAGWDRDYNALALLRDLLPPGSSCRVPCLGRVEKKRDGERSAMSARQSRQLMSLVLLATTLLGIVIYLSGLSSTLQLGDTAIAGFLLVPALPTPLYMVMAAVVLVGVGMAFLASFLQRRRSAPKPPEQRQDEAVKTPWQTALSMLGTMAVCTVILVWLMRHSTQLEGLLERLRAEVGAAQEFLASTRAMVQQVPSPTGGYALFTVVVAVYGGLAVLALWVLLESRYRVPLQDPGASAATRRVRRAVQAGLRALQEHQEPRQAIIACYAHLEHLLEDHGMPTYQTLTPQEYMGAVLVQVELPMAAFAGLVELFELARYSVHPLDDSARSAAVTYLKTLQTHLEWNPGHGAVRR